VERGIFAEKLMLKHKKLQGCQTFYFGNSNNKIITSEAQNSIFLYKTN